MRPDPRSPRLAVIGIITTITTIAAITSPPGFTQPRTQLSILETQDIFPAETWHNHGSSVVEAADGTLLACWYHGSGERKADDVAVLGALKRPGHADWSAPFVLADTPGFPEANPMLFVDEDGNLHLYYATIQANTWESALMKIKVAKEWTRSPSNWLDDSDSPRWDQTAVLHMKPGERFAPLVDSRTRAYFASLDQSIETAPERSRGWAERNIEMAKDKLTRRLGWFGRSRPTQLQDGRILLGLYSDGFSFGAATFSDDGGETWSFSEPIVGGGAVQPSFAQRRDGTVVAFMRDNGPAPKRVLVAESPDGGDTWSIARDHPDLLESGTGVEALVLPDGRWVVIHNDLERGRYRLSASISHDEGRTFTEHLPIEEAAEGEGRFHYPAAVPAGGDRIHLTYSHHTQSADEQAKTIRYALLELAAE